MRIGIVGYGRMGRLIHRAALARGHEVPVVVDPSGSAPAITSTVLGEDLPQVEVVIDFSNPSAVPENVKLYGQMQTSAVIGTTGWYGEMDKVAQIVKRVGIGVIWSGNFSLGVNLFFQLVRSAGEIINRFDGYDVTIHEMHHHHKVDSPSGTAEMLGHILLNAVDRKKQVASAGPNIQPGEEKLLISSARCGSVPGVHQVIIDGDSDTILLEHSARNREGFASGAVMAAEWIAGRKGFYNIDDMMQTIIGGKHNENS
jgi:4-hydroxy-tetrahydrodipicolinate reductase